GARGAGQGPGRARRGRGPDLRAGLGPAHHGLRGGQGPTGALLMRITSSIEYAARLMVVLARGYGGSKLTTESLSASENVSGDYVNQILLRLKRAGLVESHRGSGGGYCLSRPPAQITLGQVVRAVEGSVLDSVCDKYEGPERDCHHQGGCAISPVWKELGRLIEGF